MDNDKKMEVLSFKKFDRLNVKLPLVTTQV